MSNRVTGELNDSVAPGDDAVDSFLDQDDAANKASVLKKDRKSARPQSAYESFRKSA